MAGRFFVLILNDSVDAFLEFGLVFDEEFIDLIHLALLGGEGDLSLLHQRLLGRSEILSLHVLKIVSCKVEAGFRRRDRLEAEVFNIFEVIELISDECA